MTVLADPPPPVDNTWAAPGVAVPATLAIAVVVFFLVRSVRGGVRDQDDFLLAGHRIGPGQNALALAAAPLMYSTLFIITGHVALSGYDAVLLLTSFTMSMMLGVLLFASHMRNLGATTLGDVFAMRARERPARIAASVVTLTIYAMFTVITLAAIAFILNRWFGLDSLVGLAGSVLVVGLVTVLYVYMGGMPGVTRVLTFKAVVALGVVAMLTTLVLVKFDFDLVKLLDTAEARSAPQGDYDLLGPGRLFGEGADRWVHLSKLFCVVVGVAAIPFLFMRNFAVTNGPDARRSAGWAAMIVVAVYACMAVVGLGSVAVLGRENIGVIKAHRDISLPKLADELGGPLMVGALGAVAVLTVAGVFAALLINAVTCVTRDINVLRGRRPAPERELADVRRNVKIIGIVSVVGGVAMLPVRTHIFIPTSIDVAGATILPVVVYTLFWRRFNTAGLKWAVYGGLVSTMFMVVFSNGMSGAEDAIFAGSNFKFIDIEPGLISVPLAFLLGFLGTVLSGERDDRAFAETQVRSLTGAAVPAHREATVAAAVDDGRANRTTSEAH
ncbi:cation/acetate symporter [Actinomadura pelletieri DSM 43383]|uniref:Cation/acetate symporter n=1 Tax=Actinomadura pelletieri DSM 43383 TaxID=1120940 RepID=A0A495QKR5_9ACTN|nr:Na+:solute symporter [Actinomadura pelletieri]RKS73124.1 cation/acetate symporter [Actinomadura pelletieri DSM 43383]